MAHHVFRGTYKDINDTEPFMRESDSQLAGFFTYTS